MRVDWLRRELRGGFPGPGVDARRRPFVEARGKLRRESHGAVRDLDP